MIKEGSGRVVYGGVSSDDLVDAMRRDSAPFPQVEVTPATLLDRVDLGRLEIAWETEVWVADAPDHLIHFNGERFLGPYQE